MMNFQKKYNLLLILHFLFFASCAKNPGQRTLQLNSPESADEGLSDDLDDNGEKALTDAEVLAEAVIEYKNELNSKIAFSTFKTLYPNSTFVTYEDILQLNCSGTFPNSTAQVKAQGYVHALDIVQLENLPVVKQTYDAYLADATNGSNEFKILTKIFEIHQEFKTKLTTKFQACDAWSKKARLDVPGDTPAELPPSKD